MLAALRLRLDQHGLLDLDTWLVDSTPVRTTKSAAGGTKKKPSASVNPIERSVRRNFLCELELAGKR
ncbi:hypothetical protein GCM10027048_22590 [Hymenobacter coalescens]